MGRKYAAIALLIMSAVIFIASTNHTPVTGNTNKNITGCAPGNDDEVYVGTDGKFIRIMPGWGDYSYSISTNSDSAQYYFNQGLTMYYSYHSREAIASFREAARFDSTSAMIYWGEALALGPTYNYGYSYKQHKTIPGVIADMNRYATNASVKEKDLIDAMNKRYNVNDAEDKERNKLNEAYATAMKPLVTKYADDIDIKALYTDAVMLLHPWSFWNNNGKPKPWTEELVQNCKHILEKDPQHPAALHYYIHVTEASRDPEVALFCADSLKKLFPGVAHMVHMSSHEYERIGYYALGVDANEKADASLVVYDSLAKGLYPTVHSPHYYAVDAYCAMSGAMYKEAIPKALACRHSVNPSHENTYQQYQYMFPELAWVRLGKWNEILRDTTTIPADWTYASILSDFAIGMANAKTGKIESAENNLQSLRSKRDENILKTKFIPHTSSPYECAIVAENILLATINFEKGAYDAAISAIQIAIKAEDKLIYSEPKVWMIPARQYLGAYYMHQNKIKAAEKTYREDLVWNPGNGWSLLGLTKSLMAQSRSGDAEKYHAKYLNSFSHADVLPVVSAY